MFSLPSFFIRTALLAVVLAVALPAPASAQLGEGYATKVDEYDRICKKNEARRFHGFNCRAYASYKACLEIKSGMSRDFGGGSVDGRRPVISFNNRRSYVAVVPPECLPQYDVLKGSILGLARRQHQLVITRSKCDFDDVLKPINKLNALLGYHQDALNEFQNELAGQNTSLEEIGAFRERAAEDKRNFKSGTEKANSGLPKLKGSFAECSRYRVSFTEGEAKILQQCNPDLYNSVLSWNKKVEDRFHQLRREENTSVARMGEGRADIRECKSRALISVSDLSLLTICRSPRVSEVRTVNSEITAMNEQLAKADSALKAGEKALEDCLGLDRAKGEASSARSLNMLERHRCAVRHSLQGIIYRIENQTADYKDIEQRIGGMLASAESNLRYCKWPELNQIQSDAARLLPDSQCWQEFPIFSRQNTTLTDLNNRERNRFQEVTWRKDKMLQLIPQLEHSSSAETSTTENRTALEQLVQSSRREGYDACMGDLIARADAALASSRPFDDSPAGDWGFSENDSTDETVDQERPQVARRDPQPASTSNAYCDTIRTQFYGAIRQRDAARAQGLLNQGRQCSFYRHGVNALRTISETSAPTPPARRPAAPARVDCAALARDYNAAMSARNYALAGRLAGHLQTAGCKDPSYYANLPTRQQRTQQTQRCAQYQYQIETGLRNNDQSALASAVSAARSAGCTIDQRTWNAIQNANRYAQERRNQRLSNAFMNLGNMLAGVAAQRAEQERRNAPPPPQAWPQPNYPDYSGRNPSFPSGGGMNQRPIPEPNRTTTTSSRASVSEGDKQSRRRRVKNLHRKWYKARCGNSMPTGCAVEPKNAKDGLMHNIDNASTPADLQRVDRKIGCVDGCFTSSQGQDYSVLQGCMGRCQ